MSEGRGSDYSTAGRRVTRVFLIGYVVVGVAVWILIATGMVSHWLYLALLGLPPVRAFIWLRFRR